MMKRFLHYNGLSVALFALFLLSIIFHSVAGQYKYNEEQLQHGSPAASYSEYIVSTTFMESVAENWESEFLQLFTFVLLTRFLYQKGSPESDDPDSPEEVEPDTPYEKLPWPVKKGGWVLKIYEHSLSITFFILFLLSVALHAVGGAGEYNQEQLEHGGGEQVTAWGYMLTSTFWYESMQIWQSEFLALFAMGVLAIWLREKDSPESKEVNAPHDQTGR